MKSDFCSYDSKRVICDECHELLNKAPKITSRRVVIGTWAMLIRQPPKWFEQFSAFICDEAHQANTMALSKIINNLPHVSYRFGFTRNT
jgi:superfamily II DNA or RNA helicase